MEKTLGLPKDDTILDLRRSIDNLDAAFMFLLAERMRVIVKVGTLKKGEHLSFSHSDERADDLKKTYQIASERNLNQKFIEKVFARIYQEALELMELLDKQGTKTTLDDIFYDLGDLRESIYHMDVSFCYLMVERFRLVAKVGRYKKKHNIAPLASKRWEEVLETKSNMAEKLGINQQFVQDILNMIHKEALRIEGEIIKQN